jgi:hypothetical protein
VAGSSVASAGSAPEGRGRPERGDDVVVQEVDAGVTADDEGQRFGEVGTCGGDVGRRRDGAGRMGRERRERPGKSSSCSGKQEHGSESSPVKAMKLASAGEVHT